MDILVCIKQVPGAANVAVDEVTGVLKRDGVESKMNPYDLFALETAFRIKEEKGGSVTALSMGPPQAREILLEAIQMGADEGCLLTDRRFAGADVAATGYTLAQGIRRIGPFDLIICGKQTTDGDTAQVGAEMAEFLNLPHAAYVTRFESVTRDQIILFANLEHTVQKLSIQIPCVVTVEKDLYTPRLPSYKRRLQTQDKQIRVLTLQDLGDQDERHYGLSGSPTQVEKIFPPEQTAVRQILTGSAESLSGRLLDILAVRKVI
ncbi:MAG: electron transfer flavoprotein subunit beta/FixA family protein [Clostridiaceae bacterium]|nr:electron transfer flavoprotein subunit beta/FixA family protein [Clostridiaceae bacterium]